jgi:DNA polymerase III alpha subunit
VVNPDVNLSDAAFSVRSRVRQTISYGLSHIKKVGELPAQAIVQERLEHGDYKSFVGMVERNQVRGLSMAAVRSLWKKAKSQEEFPTLEEMMAQGVVDGASIEVARAAIQERENNGPYKSFSQVLERNGLKTGTNQATWESLIRSGACDEFGSRHELLAALPQVLKEVTKLKTSAGVALEDLVNQERRRQMTQKESPKVLRQQDLDDEEALLGLPLSGHRMDIYQQELSQRGVMTMEQVMSASKLPPRIRVAGNIKSKYYTKTKKAGKNMAIVKIEDATGEISVMFFESMLDDLAKTLAEGNGPLLIRGERMPARPGIEESDSLTLVAQQVGRLEMPVIAKPVEVEVTAPVELLAPDTEALVSL